MPAKYKESPVYESLLLWQSSTAKALNCPLTQELVPPEQVLLLTCITCSGISKVFHSLKVSVWYISTLKKKKIKKKSNNEEQWNSCNLNNNFKSFSTRHAFQHNKQHSQSSQDTYCITGETPWDKTEIINHILKAEKMKTFLSIK